MRRTIFGLGLLAFACSGGPKSGDPPGACDAGAGAQMIKGSPVSADQPAAWNGTSAIAIVSQNGDLTVVGDSSDGKVHITATPFVMAAPCDDGVDEALADVASEIRVAPDGTTGCSYASKAYGSVPRASTGCTDVTVHVPSGTADQPLRLDVHAFDGSIVIRNVNLSDHDCMAPGPDGPVTITCPLQFLSPPVAQADRGDITITGATGSVYAVSGGGSVTVSDTPNAPLPNDGALGPSITTSYVVLEATGGDASLSLPSNFAADALDLSAYMGTVTVTGFPDLNANSLSRGDAGTGATLVSASANKGNVALSAL